jgi:hypothetical protein
MRAVEYEFHHRFGRMSSKLAEIFPNWPNFTQIGAEKPTTGRISANLDDIRPKSWRKFSCMRSTVFKRISAKKFTVYSGSKNFSFIAFQTEAVGVTQIVRSTAPATACDRRKF